MADFTYTIADIGNNQATLTITPPLTGAPLYDFAQIQVDDTLIILGPHFSAGNRGEFVISAVDVANKQVIFTNSNVVAEEITLTVSASALEEVSFWHSRIKTVYDNINYVYASSQSGSSKISIPVSTDIITRNSSNAAYFNNPHTETISTLTRLPDGSVTVSFSSSLQAGQHILIEGFLPKLVETSDLKTATGTPATPSVPEGTTDHSQFTHTSVSTYYTGINPVCVRDLNENLYAIGGRNIETDTDINRIFKYTITETETTATLSKAHSYSWDYLDADFAGTGISAVLIDYPRFWNHILITGGYLNGPDYTPGDGFVDEASYLYSVANHELISITDTAPSPGVADAALVWVSNPGYAVLIGGVDTDGDLATCVHIWDPSYCTNNQLGQWSSSDETGLLIGRVQPKAVLLDTGKILAIGGRQPVSSDTSTLNNVGKPLNTCELLTVDPDFETPPALTGQMGYSRFAFGTVKLPDGRVLVVGGIGGLPCEPIDTSSNQQDHELKSCEIYDPNLGIWYPIKNTLEPHSYCTCELDSANNRVYVCGGATSTKVEYLDLATMTWHFSAATIPVSFRAGSCMSLLDPQNPIILRVGGDDPSDETNVAQEAIIQVYKETASSKGINGLHKLTTSTTFSTPNGWTKNGSSYKGEAMVVTAEAGEIKGPYCYDKGQAFGLSGVTLTPQTTIPQGRGCPEVTVTEDLTGYDLTGWLVLNFGYKNQTVPIRYRIISQYVIQPDPHFYIPEEYSKGSTIISLISQTAAYVPSIQEQRGAFYLTASNAGLEAAKQYLYDISATGIDLSINVRYPGDRGLGNEGKPTTDASKLSDIIEVFGPNDLDAFLKEVRNGD